MPVIRDPSKSVHSFTTFSYDDLMILPPSFPGGHIRAVREGDWTYAVYFRPDGSGLDYELYNVKSDPGQLNNLLYQRSSPPDARKEWLRLHLLLTARLVEVANLPDTFSWPIEPVGA